MGDEGNTLATYGEFGDADGDDTMTLSVPAGTPGAFTHNGDGTFAWSLDTTDDSLDPSQSLPMTPNTPPPR